MQAKTQVSGYAATAVHYPAPEDQAEPRPRKAHAFFPGVLQDVNRVISAEIAMLTCTKQ